MYLERLGDVHHRAAGDRKIVYNEAVLAFHVADNVQDLRLLAVIKPGLVPDCNIGMKLLGKYVRALGAAGIRSDDDKFIAHKSLPPHIFGQKRRCVQVIDRLFEKALNLRRMQIHEQDAVHTGRFDTVGANARADGYARLILLVALCVRKVRNDCSYGICTGTLECINPEKQLGKFRIRIASDRLNEIYVVFANTFVDPNKNIAFGEHDGLRVSKFRPQKVAHPLCKGTPRSAGKNLDTTRTLVHNNLTCFVFRLFALHREYSTADRKVQPFR